MFIPIIIPNKNTHDLKNDVNLTSKKLKFSGFLDFLCSNKNPWKSGRKTSHHESVCVG